MRERFIFLFIAITSAFAFSQERGNNIKVGIGSRVAFSIVDMIDDDISLNLAIGVVAKIPVINILSLNLELNLAKRNFLIALGSSGCAMSYPVSIEEIAISIPMLIQLMPLGGPLFYLEGGVQFDIPIATKIYETDSKGHTFEIPYYTRANYDREFVLGLGWNISKHSAFGLRSVWGLTDVVKEEDVKYISLGLSFSYFL